MIYNRVQIIHIKRMAMATAFWLACPLDDDSGYDRLMKITSMQDVIEGEFGSIYLHDFLKNLDYEEVINFVRKGAIKLVQSIAGCTTKEAESALLSHDTTLPLNDIYTQLDINKFYLKKYN